MDKCLKVAALYIASLKAIMIIHLQSHWTTKGATFYGDHLLFERLYKSAAEDADLAAEKFIGTLGAEVLDYTLQTELLGKVLSIYNKLSAEPMAMSIKVEKDFLKLSEECYKLLKEEGRLTLGQDDAILAICSNREESVYLLQQTLDIKD